MTRCNSARLACAAGLLLLLGSGCAQLPKVHDRFAANRAPYRQAEVLPIVFDGHSDLDASLTLTDQQRINHDIARTIADHAAAALRDKGYTVLSAPQGLGNEADWEQLDPTARELLRELHAEFGNVATAIGANLGAEAGQPFRYRLGTRLDDLRAVRSSPPADLVVLISSRGYYQSRGAYWARFGKTMTLGLLLLGADFTRNNIMLHSVAVVDARTRELLWFNHQLYFWDSYVDPLVMAGTIDQLLRPLREAP